jgi:hypothetical protein
LVNYMRIFCVIPWIFFVGRYQFFTGLFISSKFNLVLSS